MGKQKSKKHKRRDTEIEKRKERQQQKLNNSNLHHFNPTSRIPRFLAEIQPNLSAILEKTGLSEKELIDKIYSVKIVEIRIHDAWHELFSNMFAWQAVEQIKLWSASDLSDFRVFINDERRKAWNTVFGSECLPREAIEIIKADWWPEYPPVADFYP